MPPHSFCSIQTQIFSSLLFFIFFQALIYYCEALTQPNLQLQKAACLALRFLKVRDNEFIVALGFTLNKGYLRGTNSKRGISTAAAIVVLFCIAALLPFTDTVLFGNGLEAPWQNQPGSVMITKFILSFALPRLLRVLKCWSHSVSLTMKRSEKWRPKPCSPLVSCLF